MLKDFVLVDIAEALGALPSNIIPHLEPPTEFRIFRAGANATRKGTFVFDAESAKSVQAKSEAWGVEHAIDYNHAMVSSAPEQGKAAGWFKLGLRNGELWAEHVRWTPEAHKALSQGEWRYISPTFIHDKSNRVSELLNVAITNLPATHKLDPLVSLSLVGPLAGDQSPLERSRHMELLLTALGLASDATESAAVQRAAKLVAAESRAESLAVQVQELTARVRKSESEQLTASIDAAVQAGKLAPAQRAWAVSLGEKAPDALREFLESAPVQVKIEDSTAKSPGAPNPGATAMLTAEDRAVMRQLGLSEKDMLAGRSAFVAASA